MSEGMPEAEEVRDEAEKRSPMTEWLLWLVLLVPVIYVLSIGPVAWGLVHWPGGVPVPMQEGVALVYKPLDWLHDSTPMKKPLEKYVELWIGTKR